jgi:hypothetical protein
MHAAKVQVRPGSRSSLTLKPVERLKILEVLVGEEFQRDITPEAASSDLQSSPGRHGQSCLGFDNAQWYGPSSVSPATGQSSVVYTSSGRMLPAEGRRVIGARGPASKYHDGLPLESTRGAGDRRRLRRMFQFNENAGSGITSKPSVRARCAEARSEMRPFSEPTVCISIPRREPSATPGGWQMRWAATRRRLQRRATSSSRAKKRVSHS